MFCRGLFVLRYNHDVVCVIDTGKEPVCHKEPNDSARRNDIGVNLPIYDPYIRRTNAVFYECSKNTAFCDKITLNSIIDISIPDLRVKSCTNNEANNETACEILRYIHLKNIDKLLFLSTNIKNKQFYLIDCLQYSDGQRVCHKKDITDTLTKLVDIGNIVRPDEKNVLLQDEMICEEDTFGRVLCDLNKYIPYPGKVKAKESASNLKRVLLKSSTFMIILTYTCIGDWCGYSGQKQFTRRSGRYEDPGGKMYRCFIANRQQICKEMYGRSRQIYNERDWLND